MKAQALDPERTYLEGTWALEDMSFGSARLNYNRSKFWNQKRDSQQFIRTTARRVRGHGAAALADKECFGVK